MRRQESSPTQRAPDVWESARFTGFFLASSFLCSQAESTPAPAPVTQAVEAVEKVPFYKLMFEKWDKNIEKSLIFCLPNNILAIFEPGVGDFL